MWSIVVVLHRPCRHFTIWVFSWICSEWYLCLPKNLGVMQYSNFNYDIKNLSNVLYYEAKFYYVIALASIYTCGLYYVKNFPSFHTKKRIIFWICLSHSIKYWLLQFFQILLHVYKVLKITIQSIVTSYIVIEYDKFVHFIIPWYFFHTNIYKICCLNVTKRTRIQQW